MANFIGFGTGRSGTKSLSRVIANCNHSRVVHEKFLTKWGKPDYVTVEAIVQFLLSDRYNTNGVVALSHINVVDMLEYRLKNLKLVHIWRDQNEVAESFCREHGGISRVLPRDYNKAVTNSRTHTFKSKLNLLAGHPDIFPKIVAENCFESYSLYWDEYMDRVNKIKSKFYIYELNVNELNDDSQLTKLFDYLEIPNKDRVYPKIRKYR